MRTKHVVGGAGIGVASLGGFVDDAARMTTTAGHSVAVAEVVTVSGVRGAEVTFTGSSGVRIGTQTISVPRVVAAEIPAYAPSRTPVRYLDVAEWALDGVDVATGSFEPDEHVCVDLRSDKRVCR